MVGTLSRSKTVYALVRADKNLYQVKVGQPHGAGLRCHHRHHRGRSDQAQGTRRKTAPATGPSGPSVRCSIAGDGRRTENDNSSASECCCWQPLSRRIAPAPAVLAQACRAGAGYVINQIEASRGRPSRRVRCTSSLTMQGAAERLRPPSFSGREPGAHRASTSPTTAQLHCGARRQIDRARATCAAPTSSRRATARASC
ncbi:MAG: pilus assembly protein PilP [Comamonadaceae bacterium]|nr:pilus assembly protein PilP [Comamonadaceae bacterium]